MTRFAAIIVAGGSGTRSGREGPKQWEPLLGRRVIDWSVDAFRAHPGLVKLVVVCPQGSCEAGFPDDVAAVEGGQTRTASVQSGLRALDTPGDMPVLIHDAARPGLTAGTIDSLLAALASADGAAPALPVADALKDTSGASLRTVARDGLRRVQTPQAFRKCTIEAALADAPALVDDLEAVEATGARIALVPGDMRLHKITYPEDFDLVTRLLAPANPAPRVGKGFDVHGFEPGDHVTLCGVHIPHSA